MRRPRSVARPLADLLDSCLGPTLAAQGFATSDVITAWPEIVGSRLCAFTQPLKIEWKRRGPDPNPQARPEPATLLVRVESAFALEMQHLAPVVIERVNGHYGWRCGPVRRAARPPKPAPEVDEGEGQRIGAAVEAIADDDLKAALDRLGRAVVGAQSRARPTKA